MSEKNSPDLLLRIVCAISGADASLIAACEGTLERHREIRHAVALVLTFIIAAVLWGAVLSVMLPPWGAALGGMLVGMIIYLLDVSIATSDWELKGVLAESMTASFQAFRRALARWVKVAIRLGLTLVLATVTGTYATLWVFNESVETHLHAERQAHNAPIEAAYQATTERLRAELLAGPLADRKAIVDERGDVQQRLRDSQSALIQAEQAATDSRLELHREETGTGGRAAGRGPRFQEAELQLEAANRRVARAQHDLEMDRARLLEIESRIPAIDERVREADTVFQARAAALAVERDAKLRPEKSDFLMGFQALNQMKEHSAEVTFVSYATKAVIVIFELIFFLMYLNSHASTYMVRLIARTRLETTRVDVEFGRALRQINEAYGDAHTNHPSDAPGSATNSTTAPADERRWTPEQPLFEPVPAQSEPAETPEPWLAHVPAPEVVTPRHTVIGGESGEVVGMAEALANPDRYWVNPDRPDEIWNRRHRDGLLGSGYDKAA